MLLSDLEACLRQVNLAGLNLLDHAHGLNPDPALGTEAARVYPTTRSPRIGSGIHAPSETGFVGRTAGGHTCPEDLEERIGLVSPERPRTSGRVAVGALIDSLIRPVGDDPPQDPDLPVVLTVGINPGWQGQPPAPGRDFLAQPPSLHEDTGLRPRLESVVGLLRTQGGYRMKELPSGGSYHLVTASFFPWVTRAAWPAGVTPVLAEELLLGYFGWGDPLSFIVHLVKALWRDTVPPKATGRNRGITHIVFHGADNAAARCGRALIGQMNENFETLFTTKHPLRNHQEDKAHKLGSPEVIFCDDLASVQMGRPIENAVRLRREYYGDDGDALLDLGE